MAWEERNGTRYYYRKHRTPGGTVKSQYVGRGPVAKMIAAADRREREAREAERRRLEKMKEKLLRQRDRVREVQEAIRAVERAALLLNGYHTHKGQWRKRREH